MNLTFEIVKSKGGIVKSRKRANKIMNKLNLPNCVILKHKSDKEFYFELNWTEKDVTNYQRRGGLIWGGYNKEKTEFTATNIHLMNVVDDFKIK